MLSSHENRLPSAHAVRKPLIIAHRGASGLAPENTLSAFKLAVALGSEGVEMDVQLTADGRAVVIHDTRVNRTTNGRGSVAGFTLEKLAELDAGRWFDKRLALRPGIRKAVERLMAERGCRPAYAGESVPTLESALEVLLPERLERIYIELKCAARNRDALVDAIVTLVRQLRLERTVTLLSFDHEAIRLARERAPGIRTAATFPVSGRALITTRSIIRTVEEAGADEAALHYGLVTRRAVSMLNEKGIAVSTWTVNRPVLMRRLIASGVDAIMTNYPDRLKEIISSPNLIMPHL
ncbi:MAG TPA: glycerophosphodiester phosphodiesterase family protein [Blastocatellia bacterium]|nr:glycerophosphodiester phosphodiesterase family protein [Blastocatellia bacterium]